MNTKRSCVCRIFKESRAPESVDIVEDDVYRCFDCKAYVCKRCLEDHMGGRHSPHPITENQLQEQIASQEAEIARLRSTQLPAGCIIRCKQCGIIPGQPCRAEHWKTCVLRAGQEG